MTAKIIKETAGELYISNDVITSIAMNAAKDVEGFSSFANQPVTIKNILSTAKNDTRQVKIASSDSGIMVQLYINIKSTAKIQSVAKDIQLSVKNAVQNMTGKIVSAVDVTVLGVDLKDSDSVKRD